MVDEKHKTEDAFTAGIQLEQERKRRGAEFIIFRENIAYGKEEFTVPHSEMAMHVGVAGGKIKALSVNKRDRSICITAETDKHVKTACSIPTELIDEKLRSRLKSFKFMDKNE